MLLRYLSCVKLCKLGLKQNLIGPRTSVILLLFCVCVCVCVCLLYFSLPRKHLRTCVQVRLNFFLDSVNGIPEPVLVGKRCSTANTGAAILLVHSGSGPLCVNKIEMVLWFIFSFDHLGFFLTHYAVHRSNSFSFFHFKAHHLHAL